jgi:hypothetical protein
MFDYKWNVTDEELATLAGNFKDFTPAKITAAGQELYVYQNFTVVPLSEANRMFLKPISNDQYLASLQTFVWATDRKTMFIEQPIDSRVDNERKGNALQFAVENCLRMIGNERPEVAKAERTDADRLEFMQTKAKYYDEMLRKVDFTSTNEEDECKSQTGFMIGVTG